MQLFEGMPRWNASLDYTAEIKLSNGKTIPYRNPGENKETGELFDKNHREPHNAEVILFGTSFWNWRDKTVQIVGIDIDTGNHGLSEEKFNEALEAVKRVPWLELRYSKGGQGIHAFAVLSEPVSIVSRSDQAALGNAVCVAASRVCGFDVKDAKCCAGGNMWVYAQTAAPNAFEVIKPATATLDPSELPAGWREAPSASKAGKVDFAPADVELEPRHLEIEKQIADTGYPIIYVADHNCWHIHTKGLQLAHGRHGYRGLFVTNSDGSDKSKPNGFMFPLPDGGFIVHRFGDAVEHESWFDGEFTLLNVCALVPQALQHFAEGGEGKSGYVFTASRLALFLKAIGKALELPSQFESRNYTVAHIKGKLRLTVPKQDDDLKPSQWVASGNSWTRTVDRPPVSRAFIEAGLLRASQFVRAVSTETESKVWAHRTDSGDWMGTTKGEVENILRSIGMAPNAAMGELRLKPYRIVSIPFEHEYLPGRRWNMNRATYACEPAKEAGETPTWDRIWEHLGSSLDDGVKDDDNCKRVGINDGAHYLQLWFSLLLRNPLQRLPYLYFFSEPQRSGKSSLGVAAQFLIRNGVGEVTGEAFTDKFTSELEGKVLCLIEEIDLNRGSAYERIKNLVTNPMIPIRKMRMDTYRIPNTTHYIHTANNSGFVPTESEDMRVVMGEVSPLLNPIPQADFLKDLEAEAPSMLRKLLDMDIPESCDPRFWLPVVQTAVKEQVIAGVYGAGPSESEQSVLKFRDACLGVGGRAPRDDVWAAYQQFVVEGDLTPAHRNSLLTTLRDKCHLPITTKQRRVDGKPKWFYEGISLRSA